MQQLQPNTLLQGGRYKIIEMLGQGGFGITYLAIQSGLERKVAVKEFFMKELCNRDETTSHVTLGTEGSRETVNRFREKFLKEARNIARLNHPNIVRIIDVFEENGTAYYVMEYAENSSLADKVKREGYLSEPVATRYIKQVAEALDYIHQRKINHLDVKPANIMLNEKDEVVLIDFGLSKQYDASTGNQTSTTPVGISEGYAPMEQYMQGGVGAFSPETDIYALGATFYKLLTGITPPNASIVNNEGLPINELRTKGVSENTIAVIEKAMEGRKKDRLKNVRLFIDSLNCNITLTKKFVEDDSEVTFQSSEIQRVVESDNNIVTETVVAKEMSKTETVSASSHKNMKRITIFVVSISVAVMGLLIHFYNQYQKEKEDYEFAMRSTDPEVLQSYLLRYSDAPTEHRNSITTQLRLIQKEDEDWQKASLSNSRDSLQWYLDKGYTIHRGVALDIIDSLDWDKASRENSEESYENYKNQHPNGRYGRRLFDKKNEQCRRKGN